MSHEDVHAKLYVKFWWKRLTQLLKLYVNEVNMYLVRRFPVEICDRSCIRTHQSEKVLDFLPVLQLSAQT